jgi:hypothetical protein
MLVPDGRARHVAGPDNARGRPEPTLGNSRPSLYGPPERDLGSGGMAPGVERAQS